MNKRVMAISICRVAVISLLLLSTLAVGQASAQDYFLQAEAFSMTMPDGRIVPMWGFASCTDGTFATCGSPQVPGPVLSVPAADGVLNVTVNNTLAEPVSLVVPGLQATGLPAGGWPVWDDGTTGARANEDQRVRSFVHEAPAAGTATYSFAARAGTFMYQSGTNPAVQVQMGLYGMAKKNFDDGAPAAYNDALIPYGTTYTAEILAVYSEIDPALHDAVQGGTYGTPAFPSSVLYSPAYFLVNGVPYTVGSVPLNQDPLNPGPVTVNPADTVLLRLVNAGLEEHTATIGNGRFTVIAEDGNAYPFARDQYSALLPAGKTKDVLLTAGPSGNLPIFDRSLSLTNGSSTPGGLLSYLNIAGWPFASSDTLSLEFAGIFAVGTSSVAQGFTMTNTGSAPLTVSAVGTGGANGPDYAIAAEDCTTS